MSSLDLYELLFAEREIEVQGSQQVRVRFGFEHDEVVEVCVTMPDVVVVKEPPVDLVLQQYTLYLANLVTYLLGQ